MAFWSYGATFGLCWICFFVPVCLVGMWLFWKRRQFQPIKARSPWLVIATDVGLLAFTVALCIQRIIGDSYPCVLNVWSSFIGLIVICNAYAWKCWVLYFKFNLTHQRLNNNSLEEQAEFFLRHQRFTSGPFLFKIFGSLTSAMLLGPALIVVSSNEISDGTGDKMCEWGQGRAILMAYAMVYVVVFAWFTWKLRFVSDGFWITREIHLTGCFAAVGILLWFIFNFEGFDSLVRVNEGVFPISTFAMSLCSFSVFTVSTLVPLHKSLWYNEERRQSGNMLMETDLKTFDGVLKFDAGIKSFMSFLTKEFSVENIIFYMAVEDYRKERLLRLLAEKKEKENGKGPNNLLDDGRILDSLKLEHQKIDLDEAKAIYNKYMVQNSSFQVNLPADIVKHIGTEIQIKRGILDGIRTHVSEDHVTNSVRLAKQITEPRTPQTLFDVAQLNIYNLMEADSAPRFFRSPEYKKLSEQMGEKRRTAVALQEVGIA